MSLQRRVYRLLESASSRDTASQLVDGFLLGLILLNLIAVALETVDPLWAQYRPFFRAFNTFSMAVFTLEYGLRLWSCTVLRAYRHLLWGRLRFALTPLALVDLLAIAPFYLPLLLPDLRSLRALRLLRLFRVLKMSRYSAALQLLAKVLVAKREELIVSFCTLLYKFEQQTHAHQRT